MSTPPDQIPPLPRVASSPGWLWHYFRLRYLPTAASGVAVVTAVWLWAVNLPEATGGRVDSNGSQQVNGSAKNVERQAGYLSNTNSSALQVLTNGNPSIRGGLVEND